MRVNLQGLGWRLGLPFLLLVVAETVTLAAYLSLHLDAADRARFEELARANAAFVEHASLPPSERLALDLGRVTGYAVHFRVGDVLTPGAAADPLRAALVRIPADGRAHAAFGVECAGATLAGGKGDLLLVRGAKGSLLEPLVQQVLVAFWLLAILFAWLAVRGLVRPLRSLAAKLPDIEREEPVTVPEAQRNDEIGDVARAFLAARRALRDEREQRARVEKLAVLGRMTTSLAHEIQNPVAAIKLHAQLLRDTAQADIAATVEQEAARIEDLVHQWMFLTRPEPPAMRDWDLAELLAGALRAQRSRLEHAGVSVEVRRDGAPAVVVCDGKRIGLVFSNLIGNAVQAMPLGGLLRIDCEGGADRVRVRIADSGRGFSAAALARLGEYFYSEREGGMGIGLAVAREITAAHGGSLSAANGPDGGAIVTILLPRQPKAEQPG